MRERRATRRQLIMVQTPLHLLRPRGYYETYPVVRRSTSAASLTSQHRSVLLPASMISTLRIVSALDTQFTCHESGCSTSYNRNYDDDDQIMAAFDAV